MANTLGVGFLGKMHENALLHELSKQGLKAVQQQPIKIWYDGAVVGDYCADLVVEEDVLVEFKVVKQFDDIQMAQGLNYSKATGKQICLLINFG